MVVWYVWLERSGRYGILPLRMVCILIPRHDSYIEKSVYTQIFAM